jgi:hypothetical protein
MSPDFEFHFGLRLRGRNGVLALFLALATILSIIVGSSTPFNEAVRFVGGVAVEQADLARSRHPTHSY